MLALIIDFFLGGFLGRKFRGVELVLSCLACGGLNAFLFSFALAEWGFIDYDQSARGAVVGGVIHSLIIFVTALTTRSFKSKSEDEKKEEDPDQGSTGGKQNSGTSQSPTQPPPSIVGITSSEPSNHPPLAKSTSPVKKQPVSKYNKEILNVDGDEDFWAKADEEFANNRNKGLWVKCLVAYDDNEKEARVEYLKKRVQQFKEEEKVRADKEAKAKAEAKAKTKAKEKAEEEAKVKNQGGHAVLTKINKAKKNGVPDLDLNNNKITDVTPLAGLTKLESLTLYDNKIKDLKPLAGLKKLRSLALSNNKITDVTPLAGLKKLTALDLSHNPIAYGQKTMLRKALPNCEIQF